MKLHKRILAVSLALLFTVAGNTTPAFANIDHFKTLFDSQYAPPTGPAQFVLGQLDTTGHVYKTPPEKTTVKDLIFKFTGTFDTTTQSNKSILKEWFWDHITNFHPYFSKKEHVFVVRVCPVSTSGTPNDSDCVFADAPYESYCVGTAAECKNGGTSAAFATTIYHYSSGTGFNNQTAISHFAVNMSGLDFHKLNNDGTYGDAANIELAAGGNYTTDLWYCAGNPGAAGDKNDVPPSKDEITSMNDQAVKNFNGLCDNDHPAYFRIGPTFTMPTIPTAPTDQPTSGATLATGQETTGNNGEVLPYCSILNGALQTTGTFAGCIAEVFYYGIFTPLQWIAGLLGKVFDFFLGFSLDDQSYRADFLVTAWKVIRDFSNIFFIVILIYTGLAAVFDIGKVSLKHVVPQLIINAIIINFSLFATRLAIDASNIFARVFYNQIYACKGACVRDANGNITNPSPTIGGYKQISPALTSIFDPQTIFTPQVISQNAFTSTTDSNTQQALNYSNLESARKTSDYAWYFIVLSAMAALIMFGMAAMFWKTSFFFLGRVIGLFIVMIFSPFAFLTREMPFASKLKRLNWDSWAGELTQYSLLAPIFVFFLLIIYSLATSPFITNMRTTVAQDGKVLPILLSVVLPMLIVYFLIKQGVDIAKSYAGFVGGKVQEFVGNIANKTVGFATGTAIGIASGGLGMVGRGVGAAAKNVQSKSRLGGLIDNNISKRGLGGWLARRGNNVLTGAQKASFDPRNSKFLSTQAQSLGNQIGIKTKADNSLLTTLKLGTKETQGGYKAYEERKAKEIKEQIEQVDTHYKTDKEATAFYDSYLLKELAKEKADIDKLKNDDALLDKIARKQLDDKKKEEEKKGNTFNYTTADVAAKAAENKTKLQEQSAALSFTDEASKKAALDKYRSKKEKEFGKVKDNKTLTQAMRLRYAKVLAEDPADIFSQGVLRTLVNPLLAVDQSINEAAKKSGANKYIKDAQKSFKSTEKAAQELGSIDKTLTEILVEMHKNDKTGRYSEFRNSKGDLDSKEMDDDQRNTMLKEHRTNLDSKLDEHEQKMDELRQKMRNPRSADIDLVQKAYDEAVARGDRTEATRAEGELDRLKENHRAGLRTQYQAESKERNKTKEEIDDLKNILRRRSQAEQKVDGKKDTPKEDKK